MAPPFVSKQNITRLHQTCPWPARGNTIKKRKKEKRKTKNKDKKGLVNITLQGDLGGGVVLGYAGSEIRRGEWEGQRRETEGEN